MEPGHPGITDSIAEKLVRGEEELDFGLSIEKNSVHGSDSPANAEVEIKLFFTTDELFGY